MDSARRQDGRNKSTAASQPSQSNLPTIIDQDQQGQSLGQAAFWRPRHAVSAPILGQVPFLFWLTEVMDPRLILQLGLGDGVGYLALCQAAERLNSGTLCFALEPDSTTLPPDLQAEHEGHYSDFSQIIRDERITSSLPEGVGIDLLVLNSPLDEQTMAVLRDEILPRLSDNAVVLVIDPDTVLADEAARAILSGKNQPHMTLAPVVADGAAIDVILSGSTQPDQLRKLIVQKPGKSQWLAMRQAFNRLGQGIVATRQNSDLLREKNSIQGLAEKSEAEMKTLEAEIEKARASENVQIQRQAELSASIYDLQKAASQAETANKTLTAERDELAERTKKAAQDTAALMAEIAELRRALDDARSDHNERIEDIVALTARYHDDIKQADEKAAASVAALRRELSDVTAHRDALLASTSWKITSPLRRATKAVRGH